MWILVSVVSGLGIGLVSGWIGIGGGAMLVPLFVFFFKMNMYKAVGTSLSVIAPVAFVGAFSHHLRGNVDFNPVLVLALGAMVGMFVAGQTIQYIPEIILRKGFAVFLIFVAVRLLLK